METLFLRTGSEIFQVTNIEFNEMKELIKIIFALTYGLAMMSNSLLGQPMKPRVIVMTDGEVDDRCSMVRFLLYTNDVELLAIIQTIWEFTLSMIWYCLPCSNSVFPATIFHISVSMAGLM